MVENELVDQFKKDVQEYESFDAFKTDSYIAHPVFILVESPIEGVFSCKQNGWEWRVFSPKKINDIGFYQVVFRKLS